MSRPIRPVIAVEAYPPAVRKGDPLRVSARLYEKGSLAPLHVSRLYMQILGERDGNVVWPTEVVRRDASGFDIEIGTGEMQEGTTYQVRVSNNASLSPMGATTFRLQEGGFPFPVLVPLFLSPLFIRMYDHLGIRDVGELVDHLRGKGLTDAQIRERLKAIIRDIGGLSDAQARIPIDMTRDVKYKVFRTQMDHRVCRVCESYLRQSSAGLAMAHYFPDDPDAPALPIHPNCRCTFDLVYDYPEEQDARMARAVLSGGRRLPRVIAKFLSHRGRP